jgi:glycosyltransferase involved in cell wall biosynthesis
MTVKNGGMTVARAIASVQAQLFTTWELIVVDDGSTDESEAIVARIAREDARIRPTKAVRSGRGWALNQGLEHARAPLVAILDCDDQFHPAKLDVQLSVLAERADLALIGTRFMIVDGYAEPEFPPLPARGEVVELSKRRLCLSNPVAHSSVVMRREAVLSVGGYSRTRRFQFDYDLWVRLAAAGHGLANLDLPLIAKRIHPAQQFDSGKRRFKYALSSGIRQAQAIRELGGGWPLYALPVGRVLLGSLPRSVRSRLRALVSTSAAPEGGVRQSPRGE